MEVIFATAWATDGSTSKYQTRHLSKKPNKHLEWIHPIYFLHGCTAAVVRPISRFSGKLDKTWRLIYCRPLYVYKRNLIRDGTMRTSGYRTDFLSEYINQQFFHVHWKKSTNFIDPPSSTHLPLKHFKLRIWDTGLARHIPTWPCRRFARWCLPTCPALSHV